MASYAANPFYDDPFLTQAASNIAKVFIDPNPGRTQTQRAQARYYTLQGDEIEGKQRGRKTIGGVIRAGAGRVLTPQEQADIAASGIEGGIKPEDVSNYNLYYASNTGQPDSVIARAFIPAKGGLNKGEGVSLGDRENIRSTDAANDYKRSTAVAGIGAGATIQAANIHEAGANSRAQMADDRALQPVFETDAAGNPKVGANGQPIVKMMQKSVFVKAGGANPVLPNNFYEKGQDKQTGKPAFGPAGGGTVVPFEPAERFVKTPGPAGSDGKPTTVYTRAREGVLATPDKQPAEHFVPTPDPKSPTGYSLAPAGAGVPVAAPASTVKPPPKVSADELDAMEKYALRDVGAADAGFAVDPQFAETYADRVPVARAAMAEAMQQGRNSAEAQGAYLKALGITPGSKWQAPGAISRAFGSKPTFKGPGGAAPAPAAAAPASPAAVPPPQARVPGKVYPTPRGPMMWTPEGWVPPARVDDGVR